MSFTSSAHRSAGVPGTSYATTTPRHPASRRLARHQGFAPAAVQTAPPPALTVTPLEAPRAPTRHERLVSARLLTAIKTPYLENGKFDLAAYDRLVEHQIQNGVEGLIIGGTTGEGQLMSWDEHIMLIAHTVNRYCGPRGLLALAGARTFVLLPFSCVKASHTLLHLAPCLYSAACKVDKPNCFQLQFP